MSRTFVSCMLSLFNGCCHGLEMNIRRGHLRKIEDQLESSAQYKAGLRRRGIPRRDDPARASFSKVIGAFAEMRGAEHVDRFER